MKTNHSRNFIYSVPTTIILWVLIVYATIANTLLPHVFLLIFGSVALYIALQFLTVHIRYSLLAKSNTRKKFRFLLGKYRLEYLLIAATIVSVIVSVQSIRFVLLSQPTELSLGYISCTPGWRSRSSFPICDKRLTFITHEGKVIQKIIWMSSHKPGKEVLVRYSPVWPEVSSIIDVANPDESLE